MANNKTPPSPEIRVYLAWSSYYHYIIVTKIYIERVSK